MLGEGPASQPPVTETWFMLRLCPNINILIETCGRSIGLASAEVGRPEDVLVSQI